MEKKETILINVINWNSYNVTFILIGLKLYLSSWQNLPILVNKSFLPIMWIKIEKYIKIEKKAP